MKNATKIISEIKVVPVIKLNNPDSAVPLAEAMCKGGVPVAEVTFRTDAATESIAAMVKAFPEMLVGAGTVVNLEQAKRAVDAGARFIVSPGISASVVEFAKENHIPVFPGACTPTEIIYAMDLGLDTVKFFPAKQFGGLGTIKALSSPFSSVKFLPTGGISEDNLAEYLSCPAVIACGGSWMVPEKEINAGNFGEIEKLCANARRIADGTSS